MKTASNPELESGLDNDLQAEYDFDYRQARPNRFSGKIDKNQVVVILDPDISEVFTTPESVNTILRALIKAMPITSAKQNRKSPSKSAGKSALR